MGTILSTILAPISALIGKLIPDATARQAALAAIDQLKESDEAKAIEDQLQLQLSALANVKAEAQGASWLQRNWRPIVALFFAGLVGAYWFGYTAPNLPPASIEDLFTLVKICLGGYYVGRTVEKTAQTLAPAIGQAVAKR